MRDETNEIKIGIETESERSLPWLTTFIALSRSRRIAKETAETRCETCIESKNRRVEAEMWIGIGTDRATGMWTEVVAAPDRDRDLVPDLDLVLVLRPGRTSVSTPDQTT
jgi:hypothetical protein